MLRFVRPHLVRLRLCCCHPNCHAAMILCGALTFLVLGFQAQPAGAQFGATAFRLPQLAVIPATAGIPTDPALLTTSGAAAPKSAALEGKLAHFLYLAMLDDGRRRLEGVTDYTATFCKQERVDEDLTDVQSIVMKLRHKPFSVYMRWLEGDIGREVIYVDGQHENRMLVKKGGRVGRLIPSLKLDPEGSLAMAESRYPVTEVGLLTLTNKLTQYGQRDLQKGSGTTYRMVGEELVDKRACYRFGIEYASPEIEPLYRKSWILIDKELSLPVSVKNYTWPETASADPSDEETLIENYSYVDVKLEQRLADNDFNPLNKEYTFKR